MVYKQEQEKESAAAPPVDQQHDDDDLEKGVTFSTLPFSKTRVGDAGDFTDYLQLLSAYSTAVQDQQSVLFRPILSYAMSMSVRGKSDVISSTGGGREDSGLSLGMVGGGPEGGGGDRTEDNNSTIAEASPPRLGKAPSAFSARTPSYTDRILTHSLPAKASGLRIRAYDMCDQVSS